MSAYRPLTALAQESVAAVLEPGALAIDATVGNGHDTLFLAERVAPNGHVIGFEVQPKALAGTGARLAAAGLAAVVTLHLRGHENMSRLVPGDWHGRVSAAMFNLGYLPGGDKRLITRAETTCNALDQAFALLRSGGLLSLMLYRGHPGADDETAAVHDWIATLGQTCRIRRLDSPGPLLFLIERLRRM